MEFSREAGHVLLEEAKRQGLTVRAVGERTGNRNALFKLLRPTPATVTLETFAALSRAVDVPVSELAYRVESRIRARAESLSKGENT